MQLVSCCLRHAVHTNRECALLTRRSLGTHLEDMPKTAPLTLNPRHSPFGPFTLYWLPHPPSAKVLLQVLVIRDQLRAWGLPHQGNKPVLVNVMHKWIVEGLNFPHSREAESLARGSDAVKVEPMEVSLESTGAKSTRIAHQLETPLSSHDATSFAQENPQSQDAQSIAAVTADALGFQVASKVSEREKVDAVTAAAVNPLPSTLFLSNDHPISQMDSLVGVLQSCVLLAGIVVIRPACSH